jgi:methyl-accepting chemotaxis protein
MSMVHSAIAHRLTTRLFAWRRKIAQVVQVVQVAQVAKVVQFAQAGPGWRLAGIGLAALALLRLLPASWLHGADRLLGRPGDALLAASLLLLLSLLWLAGSGRLGRLGQSAATLAPAAVLAPATSASLAELLDHHLQLDALIDNKLCEVVGDTESSALEIITQVRNLYDTAARLVSYLDSSSVKAGNLGQEIVASVGHLVEIGAFIARLPAKMERDLESVQGVAREIKELGGLVEAVQAIAMQSHMLAINASIEASRAGASGFAFRVLAQEMRHLASNSGDVATKIRDGLSRARVAVEGGMAASIAESSRQLDDVSHAVNTIQKIQDNFEDMSQYYKTRFAVITQHNQDLAKSIAEVLGQIQYQDVVRQCIERIRVAILQRNGFLEKTFESAQQGEVDLAQLSALLASIRDDYENEEEMHKHSARHEEADGGELKIELF